jgi:hypothetical protein
VVTIAWNPLRFPLIVALPKERTFNAEYYRDNVLAVLIQLQPEDLSPSDFFLFGYVNEHLKGMVFPSYEELLVAIGEVVTGIESETLTAVFEHWMERPE